MSSRLRLPAVASLSWTVLLLALGCRDNTGAQPEDAGSAPKSTSANSAVNIFKYMGTGRIGLPVEATQHGVTRMEPQDVGEGPSAEDPSVAVGSNGRVGVVFSMRQDNQERIAVRWAPTVGAPLSPPEPITPGMRAWHPRLKAGGQGQFWLAWCGRLESVERDDHRRTVFLMRLGADAPASPLAVSKGSSAPEGQSRHCDPDLHISKDGTIHVVWEASEMGAAPSTRIAYRRIHPDGKPAGAIEYLSTGPFDCRPSITESDEGLHVAWDRWVDERVTGAVDPDYDVFLRTGGEAGWGQAQLIDGRVGIQAAPALAPAPTGGVMVAYHTSHRHGLVKWWALRRVQNGRVQGLADMDPATLILPRGEQQGAEIPALSIHPDGKVVLSTRTAQGAYLHVIDSHGIRPAFDLTRRGWGARGLRSSLTIAKDGTVLLARRARHDVILERFALTEPAGPPRFEPVVDPAKPKLESIEKPVVLRSSIAKAFEGATVHWGDMHMHSAVSDGTGTPDEIYARAWVRGHQFATLTDHDFVAGARMMLSEYDEIKWLTDVFDTKPGFTTLHAYEWTTRLVPKGSGHRNVYFRSWSPTVLFGSRSNAKTAEELHKALHEERAFTAPHHTGWTGTDWDFADPEVQRHFEIVSVHGAFGDPRSQPLTARAVKKGMMAVDGLRLGKKFGFIGGSDGHGILWHHGIGRRMDPWSHGLTGVIAKTSDRAAIWDAMFARRTFATSGAPMWILTAVGDTVQGGEITLTGTLTVRWEAHGNLPLKEVTVLRDGRVVHRHQPEGLVSKGKWTDREVEPGPHSYYVRAHQGEGLQGTDAVWSSPIFVKIER